MKTFNVGDKVCHKKMKGVVERLTDDCAVIRREDGEISFTALKINNSFWDIDTD